MVRFWVFASYLRARIVASWGQQFATCRVFIDAGGEVFPRGVGDDERDIGTLACSQSLSADLQCGV